MRRDLVTALGVLALGSCSVREPLPEPEPAELRDVTVTASFDDPPVPAPRPLSALLEKPIFTAYTVAPEVLNWDEVRRVIEREYPRRLRETGVEGTARVYFLIDDDGTVVRRVLDRSSGLSGLDDAALQVSGVYRFSPATNRGVRVAVWVSFPITFGLN